MERLELFHTLHNAEVREITREDGTKAKHFRGYAIVFDTPSVIMLDDKKKIYFREVVKHGAITQEFIDSQDVVCTRQHNPDYVIARHVPNRRSSMTMTVDHVGVLVEFDFPDSPMGADCSAQVQRGDLYGMSFTFYDNAYTYTDEKGSDGIYLRTITAFDVISEVTIAAHAAYPATTAECREAIIRESEQNPDEKPENEKPEPEVNQNTETDDNKKPTDNQDTDVEGGSATDDADKAKQEAECKKKRENAQRERDLFLLTLEHNI